ncbi:SDR family NAD(P)-dependent oxidoreductase [Amnibacterium kyonggiense]|uniref:Short-subunit dehydrogenase n=1 Tax=Amnibacterium kyonggiense TaxID=595671 RepID=A0A4V3EAE9_9MICO|nr:SDR family NAD(P)-dependent oxidoreductase [Amnibacterium kyonggiense]TDS76098.1 short-subunit dehydrogenase [Amnibacterium kyonggiense]
MDLTDRSGIITGGGSGIGRELAVQLAARGASLLLVGRRADALQETADLVVSAGGTAHVLTADVTERDAPEAIVREAQQRLGTVDLLINNAGNVRAGRLEGVDPDDIRAMIDLNLTAPILLTRLALPELRRAATGRPSVVLTISSGIALVNLPFYTTYAATKTGVAAFGHALRRELHGSGVHVATLYPGATATAMMDSSDAQESLGFGRRPTADVVAETLAALERDEHEINTALPSRRRLQDLHRTAPLEVDEALAPQLADLEAAVRSHRSI